MQAFVLKFTMQKPISYPIMKAHRCKAQEFLRGWMGKLLKILNCLRGASCKHSTALQVFLEKEKKRHLSIPNMQYCRSKLHLSVNSSLLFPAPRWNEATLLLMKRNLSEANETLAHCTASQPLDPTHLNKLSFFLLQA